MYTNKTVIACLRGLIGFEQPYNADISIDPDMEASASGLFVTGLHPLLTYPNILSIAEHFERTTVRVWSGAANYKVGDVVKNVTLFRAIQPGTNHPTTDDEYWQPTTLLSAYLRRVYDQSANKLINSLFVEKKLHEVAKTLLASVSLFEGVGNISGRITKNDRLVGLRISLQHADIVAALTHIGLQLDTPQDPVKVYLYHSSSFEPIYTFDLHHTKSVTFQWHGVEQALTETSGHYYLVYKESELTGSAVKKDINFHGKTSCGTCSEAVINSRLYNQWGKFVAIQPFYVNGYEGTDLWDEDQEIYVDNTNWGINLKMSMQCDVSNIICDNRNVITGALAQQLTVDLLSEMAFSLRDNQSKEKIAQLAATALDNSENHDYGEAKKLRNAIKALSFDFSNMSPACLPCGNNQGGRLTSVWRR
ncbi:MAG TPA: hypothetical protein PK339_12485 [Flavitalea sp.]|nr:hypothetical protein [Flavitalea sp.]